jgi:phage antirepressor YoqD-like protein
MSILANFERFDKDGIELVIDTATGEVFYPGYNALARVASIGLVKPIQAVQAQRTVESALEGVTDLELKDTEILTTQGLRTVTLIPRQLGTKVIKRYNEKLYEQMAEAGHVVFLHKLAGYEVTTTAITHDLPKTYLDALKCLVASEEQKALLTAKIEKDAPLVEYAEAVQCSDTDIDFNTFAKMIGTGRTRLFRALRDLGVIMQNSTLPYQKWMDAGYFEACQEITGDGKLRPFAVITGKGQIWLKQKLGTLFAKPKTSISTLFDMDSY